MGVCLFCVSFVFAWCCVVALRLLFLNKKCLCLFCVVCLLCYGVVFCVCDFGVLCMCLLCAGLVL